MMNEEGGDDDDVNVPIISGTTRYPCMPSLMSLQQMKNRLHLAYTGKKLMKWTTRATEKELRRLSLDLVGVHESMEEELRESFLLLARARYFFPDVNRNVLMNIDRKAAVKTRRSYRYVTGVKILQQNMIERRPDTYVHLGLGSGGQVILEAKYAWRDFLKRLIWIIELKGGFREVEDAYKKASKESLIKNAIGREAGASHALRTSAPHCVCAEAILHDV